MKVLTVFSSIFISLPFIAEIYGMNFEYMPELEWKWTYPGYWTFFSCTHNLAYLFQEEKISMSSEYVFANQN